MTARAARMLAALEDGCQTRQQIFAHQGRFSLLNNAAAELRAAGVEVMWDHAAETYQLLGERGDYEPVPLVEETTGQMAIGVAA